MGAEKTAELVKAIAESGIRIRKVQWKKARISIEYQENSPSGGYTNRTIGSHEQPRPQLPIALKKMAPHVVEICELGDDSDELITVLGLSVSYYLVNEQDQRGLVITASRTLHQSSNPLVLNTPLKKEPVDGKKQDARSLMTDECIEDMLVVLLEAIRYVKGERQQTRADVEGAGARAGTEPKAPVAQKNLFGGETPVSGKKAKKKSKK